jgi:hypothetical protein
MRSRRPGSWWPWGDTRESGRRVTSKAPYLRAHVEGGSGRSAEASPTAILKDTHSVEGVFSGVGLPLYGILGNSPEK